MKPKIKFISTIATKLNDIPIISGQIIFCSDTRVIYLDTDTRTTYQAIINVVDEETRQAIEAPLEGYYYVKLENTLWSYFDNQWTNITEASRSVDFIDEEFPEEGQEKIIYVKNRELFQWNETNQDYEIIGGSQWKDF